MPKFEVECCEGSGKGCLESRCPIFMAVEEDALEYWRHHPRPFTQTGFGNLYGEPTRADYLAGILAGVKRLRINVQPKTGE